MKGLVATVNSLFELTVGFSGDSCQKNPTVEKTANRKSHGWKNHQPWLPAGYFKPDWVRCTAQLAALVPHDALINVDRYTLDA